MGSLSRATSLLLSRRAAFTAKRRHASTTARVVGGVHPLVDVGGFLDNAPTARRGEALTTLRHATFEGGPGFFYAAGVEDLLGDVAEIYSLSEALHTMPMHVKKAYAGKGGSSNLGFAYSGADVGEIEVDYEPGTKATARAWDYSRLRFKEEGKSPVQALPELKALQFEEKMLSLYERQNVVGGALLSAIAEVLELQDASIFKAAFASGDMGTIRLINYPGDSEVGPEDMGATCGISPHTDFEAFTLQHQDSMGLQVLARDFTTLPNGGLPWIDAPLGKPDGGEYIVMIGDVLERYTNGVLKATPHRVVRTPHTRKSIIRFNAMAPETVIEPLQQFVTPEKPAAYTKCTMRQHMETTIRNLDLGLGSWDSTAGRSISAHYRY